LPFQPQAVERLLALVRPDFQRMLDDGDGVPPEQQKGPRRWVADGPKLRDNGRFVGTLAEFFANREQKDHVGFGELFVALLIVQVECSAGAGELEYCKNAAVDYDAARLIISQFFEEMSKLPLK